MWWLAAVLIPAAFVVWIAGHFVRARREAKQNILHRGVAVEAEVVAVHGRRIDYRFEAPGWKQPILGADRGVAGRRYEAGERVRVRYLSGHPHLSALDSERQ
jgi:hypothetical protein